MPRSRKGLKPKRGASKKHLLLLLGVPLLICVVLFIAMDSLTLYWFLLFNNDDMAEARRKEDFHWYESGGKDYSVPDGSEGPDGYDYPTYVDDYSDMDVLEVMKLVASGMSAKEMAKGTVALRFFIYYMDRQGYVQNAIIGAMASMEPETNWISNGDHTWGTYTYESIQVPVAGADGEKYSLYENNDAWREWLQGRLDTGRNTTGLGMVQWTDTTGGTRRATHLVDYADSLGLPWQHPAAQLSFITNETDNGVPIDIWNLRKNPGPDPKSSTEITATEWAKRWYMYELSGGTRSYLTVDFTSGNGAARIAYVDEARELYEKYSGKDKWFYTKRKVDWHNPFAGPGYDNTTPQGLLLARMCVLFAGNNIANGEPKIYRTQAHGYNASDLTGAPTLKYYREGQYSVDPNNVYYASCDYASSAMIRLSGVDPEFLRVGAKSQRTAYCDKSARWEYLGKAKDVALQPGDVLFKESGHIAIWVGENVAGERWPGTTANIFQASLAAVGSEYAYFPDMQQANPKGGLVGAYYVYRCVDPVYSSKYWDKFIAHAGDMFPEITKRYSKTQVVETPTTPESPSPSAGPLGGAADWYWPLPNIYHLTSRTGKRADPFGTGGMEDHHGTDIGAVDGTPIYAAKDGTVKEVQEWKAGDSVEGNMSYGRMYKIASDDGLTDIIYAHMSANYPLSLEVGDHVEAGQQIGYSGNTGNSTGPHLHFEIRKAGEVWNNNYYDCVDIYNWMSFTNPNRTTAVPKSYSLL